MVKLNLTIDDENVEFDLPSSWEEVNVEQFSAIYSIEKEGRNEIELSIEFISILTGIDIDTIYMFPSEKFSEVIDNISFIKEDVKQEQVESIIVEDQEYFLKRDYNSLTVGESVSLEVIIDKSNGQYMKMLPELLCIFLRQKKENGNLEAFRPNFMERAELFKKVTISTVYSLFVFFSNGGALLESNTQSSSLNKTKRQIVKENK